MDKSVFESILDRRAEDVYQDKKRVILDFIANYFNNVNADMNAHEAGNSLNHEIGKLVNSKIEERKKEIIKKIKQGVLDDVLSRLDSVKFLFENSR